MIKQESWWDVETREQSDEFDEFLAESADIHDRYREVSPNQTVYAYTEAEWEAFQWGWNAARKHYGVT